MSHIQSVEAPKTSSRSFILNVHVKNMVNQRYASNIHSQNCFEPPSMLPFLQNKKDEIYLSREKKEKKRGKKRERERDLFLNKTRGIICFAAGVHCISVIASICQYVTKGLFCIFLKDFDKMFLSWLIKGLVNRKLLVCSSNGY